MIGDIVCKDIILLLYHSLILGRVPYGIVVWGNTVKTYLHEVFLGLIFITGIITFSIKYYSITALYKDLKLLKFKDI